MQRIFPIFFLALVFGHPSAFSQAVYSDSDIKIAVSNRYLDWQREKTQINDLPYWHIRRLDSGCYYEGMKVTAFTEATLPGYELLRVSFEAGTKSDCLDGTGSFEVTYDVPHHETSWEEVVVALDSSHHLHYLSGNLLLDPMPYTYRSSSQDMDAYEANLVKLRAAYLLPRDLRLAAASHPKAHVYTAYSEKLKRKVEIRWFGPNTYRIYTHQDPKKPYVDFGYYRDSEKAKPVKVWD